MTLTMAAMLGYVLGLATALFIGACIVLIRGGRAAHEADSVVTTKGRGW